MAGDRAERRLAALMAGDMVGYSRLMEADETGTIARRKAHRADLIYPVIAEHGGRIANTASDDFLLRIQSVVEPDEGKPS